MDAAPRYYGIAANATPEARCFAEWLESELARQNTKQA
ncbi:hypothetical protein PS862_03968 [Pseudomonas fluorescens]|uniref:Uncharacterized protein n=1 Tax=Pseudomonas fluorescens TaxID=294 RepID=A0A5E7MFC1_PSEFL|nr:hypothetical protein PS639_01191 [Pseudomonas fluorescens]VVP23267.1 hypothetical protein PS862_03968 [Pseudomonas fluorescens]